MDSGFRSLDLYIHLEGGDLLSAILQSTAESVISLVAKSVQRLGLALGSPFRLPEYVHTEFAKLGDEHSRGSQIKGLKQRLVAKGQLKVNKLAADLLGKPAYTLYI